MALYVNTNISSKNAQRMLANSTNSLDTSYKRLASGLRIKEKCVADAFNAGFNPRNLIVNKVSGYKVYNSAFGLPKDLAMFLFGFVPESSKNFSKPKEKETV